MNKILIILKKESREVFRDKKSLMMMLMVPFLIPVIVIGMSALFNSEVDKDINTYNRIGFNYELSDIEKEIAKGMEIDFVSLNDEELVEEFNKGNIKSYIMKKDGKYYVYYDDSDTDSTASQSLSVGYLDSYKTYLETNFLASYNVDIESFNNLVSYEVESIEKQNFFSNYIINYTFMFIIMAVVLSATYPATDATAGEKERGTLETLLTFPIKSKEIIYGKLISVSLSSFITGILSLILAIVSLIYVQNTYSFFDGEALVTSSLIIAAVVIITVVSILISCLCVAIASMSKSFKEAQSALSPVTLIAAFPGIILTMLNVNNSLLLSLIPFVNYSLVMDDVIKGNVNYLYLFTMLISTIFFIIIIINYVGKQYKSEKILFTN